MNNVLVDLDRTYEGTLTYDVSDDELEAAAEGNCAWLMPTESADAVADIVSSDQVASPVLARQGPRMRGV
jgi:hypothetical protein